jgi:hypothetical protein
MASLTRWAMGCAATVGAVHAGAATARADEGVSEGSPAEWRPIPIPALGRRLRALAVVPGRIVVGTDEGTVLVSTDAGASFAENEVTSRSPHHGSAVQRPALATRDANVALLPLTTIGAQSLILRPNPGWMPYMNVPSYQSLPLGSWPMGFTVRPQITRPAELINGPYTLFFPASGRVLDSLLDWEAAPSQPEKRAPGTRTRATHGGSSDGAIRAVALCPSEELSLLALTSHELYGSSDSGQTFVSVFALPNTAALRDVACSAARGIEVATSAGAFVSRDGGLTFEPTAGLDDDDTPTSELAHPPDVGLPSALPPVRVVSAILVAGQGPTLWAITERELYSTASPTAGVAGDAGTAALQSWAGRRLRRMPSTPTLVALALARQALLPEQVARALDGWTVRNALPRADLSLAASSNSAHPASQVSISDPIATNVLSGHTDGQISLTLTWFLPELAFPFDAVAGSERDRATIGIARRRKALEAMMRDACAERALALHVLASGPKDALAALTVASRVQVLDALIDYWAPSAELASP